MNHRQTIETYCWPIGTVTSRTVLVTVVAEAGETAISLTVTTARPVAGPGDALAELVRELAAAKAALAAQYE